MEVSEWIAVLKEFGFPTLIALYFIWDRLTLMSKFIEEMAKQTEAINTLTQAISLIIRR